MAEELQSQIEQIAQLYAQGQREQALALCDQVLQQEPMNLEAMGYRAALLRELNLTDEAVLAYQTLAEAHANQGNYLKALATARSFQSIEPDASEITTQKLAMLYSENVESPTLQESGFPNDSNHPSVSRNQSAGESDDELMQQLLDQLKADTITLHEEAEHLAPGEPFESSVLYTTQVLAPLTPPLPMDDDEQTVMDSGTQQGSLPMDPEGNTAQDVPPPLPPLFNYLDAESIAAVWQKMEALYLPPGHTLIRQGQEGESFYVIVDGTVRVLHAFDESVEDLGHLGPGQFFGEIALLTPLKRTATVETVSHCHLLRLKHSDLQQIIQQYPQVHQELQRFVHQRLIQNLLLTSLLFFPLNDVKRWELAQQFSVVEVPPETPLISEGEPADGLYIIAGGAVDVYKTQPDGAIMFLERLGPGQFFGEISLLHEQPSSYTMITDEAATFLKLHASDFANVMKDYPRVLDLLRAVATRRLEQFDAQEPKVQGFTRWPTHF